MNEKYRLDTIGYTMKTLNPMIHGDMNSTVVHRACRRGDERRARIPAAVPVMDVDAMVTSSYGACACESWSLICLAT